MEGGKNDLSLVEKFQSDTGKHHNHLPPSKMNGFVLNKARYPDTGMG